MSEIVVFDFNGTLIADTRACMLADNVVIAAYGGIPITEIKVYRNTVNIPGIDFYERHGCNRASMEQQIQEVGRIFHDAYDISSARVKLRKGAVHTLQSLDGHLRVILSNHPTERIFTMLNRFGIASHFAEVLGSTADHTSMGLRNKASRLKEYAGRSGIDLTKGWIIGDSPEEIEIGDRFGMKTVGITHGYYATFRLKLAGPDYIIRGLAQLPGLIGK